MKSKILVLSLALFSLLSLPFHLAQAEEGNKGRVDVSILDTIPIQNDGRVKPLNSFAKESLIYITGKTSFQKLAAERVLLEWMALPENWENTPFILVPTSVRESLGLTNKEKYVSPSFLANHENFMSRAHEVDMANDRGAELDPVEQKVLELYSRLNMFYACNDGRTWTIIPPREGAPAGARWGSLNRISERSDLASINEAWLAILENYRSNRQAEFNASVTLLTTRLGHTTGKKFAAERLYNRSRPFKWAWMIYLATFVVLLVTALTKSLWLERLGMSGLVAGFLLHTYGFALRCFISGRPPVTNMYESVIWVSWGAVLFALILFFFMRSSTLSFAAAGVSFVGLLVADSFPAALDPSISSLVPVLRSNLWLTVHVLSITLSYGAFALAMGIAHVQLFVYAFKPSNRAFLTHTTQLIYRSLQIGVILLAAGTILGGVWANYSWGRFWGWDPKETWALIALLFYLAILHGRFTGMIRPFGLAVCSVIAFAGVIMAWYGVNYVLASGLHSYGFGASQGATKVLAWVVADILLVGGLSLIYLVKNSRQTTSSK